MQTSHPKVKHPSEIIHKDTNALEKLNSWIAVKITKSVGTMWCAYAFFGLDLVMLAPVIKSGSIIVWVTYLAQTVLQLVLLPIIMVGQNVIQAQNDAKSEVDHETLTYLAHLQDEQMAELKIQTEILRDLQQILKNQKSE
jgi:hypothetical protein